MNLTKGFTWMWIEWNIFFRTYLLWLYHKIQYKWRILSQTFMLQTNTSFISYSLILSPISINYISIYFDFILSHVES